VPVLGQTPVPGQTETSVRWFGMSGLLSEADFVRRPDQVRSVPETDLA
jgi:hypothetical protein